MTKCIIVDLDGTLADCTHRLHHVTGQVKDWDAFFAAISADTLYEPIKALINDIGYDIILCSGRPENYRAGTEAWLSAKDVYWTHLYMRPKGDFRPDHIVKSELLDRILTDGYEPFLVIDDRPRVVAMWRSHGLTCLQCREWQEGQESQQVVPGTLHLLVGPSRAGKSTLFTHMIDKTPDFTLASYISSDRIRKEFCGNAADQSRNNEVFRYLHTLVKLRLSSGLPCVVDATNIRRKDRTTLRDLVPGVAVHYWVMDRPLTEKLRDAGEVPPSVIVKHSQVFNSNLKDILRGDDNPNVTVHDIRLPVP